MRGSLRWRRGPGLGNGLGINERYRISIVFATDRDSTRLFLGPPACLTSNSTYKALVSGPSDLPQFRNQKHVPPHAVITWSFRNAASGWRTSAWTFFRPPTPVAFARAAEALAGLTPHNAPADVDAFGMTACGLHTTHLALHARLKVLCTWTSPCAATCALCVQRQTAVWVCNQTMPCGRFAAADSRSQSRIRLGASVGWWGLQAYCAAVRGEDCMLRRCFIGKLEAKETTVKYYSPTTNICIIRVAWDHHQIAWGALTLLTAIEGTRYIPNVIHLSGTIKHAQLAAVAHNREVIARYRAQAKTPSGYQDSYEDYLRTSNMEIEALQD
ncbi:Ribonuclease P/MRP protein subunit POP5 [Mycena sanguinolenta]|uniref:Ribonuclease P/MRP protein subunit POP5 n=1 Tax=Mycena sanguinolenta TaxID=230812 RepID=A0A8H6YYU0_9AGAR|nr:Ribonuclease P/MRP protein subunit POP5 [Mycena sanguinolenta]